MKIPKHRVSIKTVILTYLGLLSLAMIIIWAMNYFHPQFLLWIYLFPVGCLVLVFDFLYYFGPRPSDNYLWLGYIIYLIMYVCALLFRRRPVFFTLLFIYVIILCLNINGCIEFLGYFDKPLAKP